MERALFRSTRVRSARAPGTMRPMSSRPRSRAPSTVAMRNRSRGSTALASPVLTLASRAAILSDSSMSCEFCEPGPSVPSATGMPRASILHTGATPEARYMLLTGQWTTDGAAGGDQVQFVLVQPDAVDQVHVRAEGVQRVQPLDVAQPGALVEHVDLVLGLGHVQVGGHAPARGPGSRCGASSRRSSARGPAAQSRR